MDIVQLDSIDAYNRLYGLPTRHPLVTVADLSQASRFANHIRMSYGIYALYLKNGENCRLKYGRQDYDYQAGTIVSFAPGQVVEVEVPEDEDRLRVLGLLFHPDLVHGTPLGRKMRQYGYFGYDQREALHLSPRERNAIEDCLRQIAEELETPEDKYTRGLLCTRIELVLDYCLRFYDRQFQTREKAHSDILTRFESLLNNYVENPEQAREGLPSVSYFADRVCLSPGYFGDLVKKETGRTAQEHIQRRVIGQSKKYLSDGDRQVNEVAYELGFQYPQHFIRLFKKIEGCTPGEFRHRFIQKNCFSQKKYG